MLQKIYAILQALLAKPSGLIYSSTTKITVIASGNFPVNTDVLLAAANSNRKGFAIYNNSTNSMYVGVGQPASASTQIGQCASNAGPTAHFYSGQLGNFIYTGPLYGRRNSGAGSAWCVEFE